MIHENMSVCFQQTPMTLFYNESTLSFSRHLHAAVDSSTEPVNIVISPLSGSMVLACYVDSVFMGCLVCVSYFTLYTEHNGTDNAVVTESMELSFSFYSNTQREHKPSPQTHGREKLTDVQLN